MSTAPLSGYSKAGWAPIAFPDPTPTGGIPSRMQTVTLDSKAAKYRPLNRVLWFNDFNEGFGGWAKHHGGGFGGVGTNPAPKISSQMSYQAGSLHPSLGSGNYCLKLSTTAVEDNQSTIIKRSTYRYQGRMRFEMTFAIHPDYISEQVGDEEIPKSWGVAFDIQDQSGRYFPTIRYLNCNNSTLTRKFQYNSGGVDPGDSDYTDLPDGAIRMCYNETVDKWNWHYFRMDIDTVEKRYVDFQLNDHRYQMGDSASMIKPLFVSTTGNLYGLFNTCIFVETDDNIATSLCIESCMLSCDEP